MMHTIVHGDLVDPEFIRDCTLGYEALKENVADYSAEAMAPICGISADTIKEVTRLYANSKGSTILWGMGVSQHVHGTDNIRCLIALPIMTGQVGRPRTGIHPLRGQNNAQGASDTGLIPMMYPNYQRVDNPEAQVKFEAFWGTRLDPKPGLTVVEITHATHEGKIKGMYIGENPAMSDPDLKHALLCSCLRSDVVNMPTTGCICSRICFARLRACFPHSLRTLDSLHPRHASNCGPLRRDSCAPQFMPCSAQIGA